MSWPRVVMDEEWWQAAYSVDPRFFDPDPEPGSAGSPARGHRLSATSAVDVPGVEPWLDGLIDRLDERELLDRRGHHWCTLCGGRFAEARDLAGHLWFVHFLTAKRIDQVLSQSGPREETQCSPGSTAT